MSPIKELIEELFFDIDSKLPRKYKKIFRQIKNSYIRKDYSLANVGLTSMIDGLCSFFIYDKRTTKRIDLFMPIIEEIEQHTGDNFATVLLIMLNNNINTIYENVNFEVKLDKKISSSKKIRRHPFQHGQFYYDEKYGVIMLLNTLINLLDTTIYFNIYKVSYYMYEDQKK